MSDLLSTAQTHLNIEGVNLRESKIFVRDDIDVAVIDLTDTVKQTFRSVLKIRELLIEVNSVNVYEYRFIYSAGIRLLPAADEEESFNDEYRSMIEIVGVFDAIYLSKDQVDKDCLEAFSQQNVGYHVWPYWREYVQSSCSRIGFQPAFTVPFYLLPSSGEDDLGDFVEEDKL